MVITVPNLVTSVRLVFWAGFIYLVDQGAVPGYGVVVLFGLAWGLDAVDGWLARRLNQATVFGFIYDKVVDRLVLAGGVLVLVAYGIVPWYGIFLLTKDVTGALAAAKRRGRGGDIQGMGWSGKAMSVVQGAALLWLIAGFDGGGYVVGAVAVVGFLAGAWYWGKINK